MGEQAANTARPKILLVDDEENILRSCRRVLRLEPFDVETTTSPEEALHRLGLETFAAIVSDQRMPQMEGTALLAKAKEVSPDTVRIILTGYADIQASIEAINRGAVFQYLTKPWKDDDLRSVLRLAVSQFQLIDENRRLQALTQKQNAELRQWNESLEVRVEERTREVVRLNEELEKSLLGSIRVLAELGELHSSVIGSHSKRVAALAKKVGEAMGLESRALFELEIAATLHDIGKIGIAPEILLKSAAARKPQEVEILRKHPAFGEKILAMVPNLGTAARSVRHHHENFDGTGYPDGLRGEKIPLSSRIIAAVDAYDNALNAKNVFENSSPEKALASVLARCPSDLDPEIVAQLRKVVVGTTMDQSGSDVEITWRDLREGMTLARDLRSAKGLLLVPRGTQLKAKDIENVRNYQASDPLLEGIFVFRRPASP